MGWAEYFWSVVSEPQAAGTAEPSTDFGTLYDKPKPRLAAVTTAPSREAFEAWRDHPVTQFVFAALRRAAAEQRAAWTETSWISGEADKNLLSELRTRADAYTSLEEADYEGFCEWAGLEPEDAGGRG